MCICEACKGVSFESAFLSPQLGMEWLKCRNCGKMKMVRTQEPRGTVIHSGLIELVSEVSGTIIS